MTLDTLLYTLCGVHERLALLNSAVLTAVLYKSHSCQSLTNIVFSFLTLTGALLLPCFVLTTTAQYRLHRLVDSDSGSFRTDISNYTKSSLPHSKSAELLFPAAPRSVAVMTRRLVAGRRQIVLTREKRASRSKRRARKRKRKRKRKRRKGRRKGGKMKKRRRGRKKGRMRRRRKKKPRVKKKRKGKGRKLRKGRRKGGKMKKRRRRRKKGRMRRRRKKKPREKIKGKRKGRKRRKGRRKGGKMKKRRRGRKKGRLRRRRKKKPREKIKGKRKRRKGRRKGGKMKKRRRRRKKGRLRRRRKKKARVKKKGKRKGRKRRKRKKGLKRKGRRRGKAKRRKKKRRGRRRRRRRRRGRGRRRRRRQRGRRDREKMDVTLPSKRGYVVHIVSTDVYSVVFDKRRLGKLLNKQRRRGRRRKNRRKRKRRKHRKRKRRRRKRRKRKRKRRKRKRRKRKRGNRRRRKGRRRRRRRRKRKRQKRRRRPRKQDKKLLRRIRRSSDHDQAAVTVDSTGCRESEMVTENVDQRIADSRTYRCYSLRTFNNFLQVVELNGAGSSDIERYREIASEFFKRTLTTLKLVNLSSENLQVMILNCCRNDAKLTNAKLETSRAVNARAISSNCDRLTAKSVSDVVKRRATTSVNAATPASVAGEKETPVLIVIDRNRTLCTLNGAINISDVAKFKEVCGSMFANSSGSRRLKFCFTSPNHAALRVRRELMAADWMNRGRYKDRSGKRRDNRRRRNQRRKPASKQTSSSEGLGRQRLQKLTSQGQLKDLSFQTLRTFRPKPPRPAIHDKKIYGVVTKPENNKLRATSPTSVRRKGRKRNFRKLYKRRSRKTARRKKAHRKSKMRRRVTKFRQWRRKLAKKIEQKKFRGRITRTMSNRKAQVRRRKLLTAKRGSRWLRKKRKRRSTGKSRRFDARGRWWRQLMSACRRRRNPCANGGRCVLSQRSSRGYVCRCRQHFTGFTTYLLCLQPIWWSAKR